MTAREHELTNVGFGGFAQRWIVFDDDDFALESGAAGIMLDEILLPTHGYFLAERQFCTARKLQNLIKELHCVYRP